MEQICSSVLGVEPTASHMTGKLSTTELHSQPYMCFVLLRFILCARMFCLHGYKCTMCMLCLMPAGGQKRAGVNGQL